MLCGIGPHGQERGKSSWCVVAVSPSQPGEPGPAGGESSEANTSNGEAVQAGQDSFATERTRLIVGIGASAGGIDALKTFFSKMPDDIGMAFVIVQHLDPNYDSSLVAIIAGYTAIPVRPCRGRDAGLPGPDLCHPAGHYPDDQGRPASHRPPGGSRRSPHLGQHLPGSRWPRTKARMPSVSFCPGSAATARSGSRQSRSMVASPSAKPSSTTKPSAACRRAPRPAASWTT